VTLFSGVEAILPRVEVTFPAGRWLHFFESFRVEASRKTKLGQHALDAARYTLLCFLIKLIGALVNWLAFLIELSTRFRAKRGQLSGF